MSYLVFDTETTSLFKKELSLTDPDQARIVQLACLLIDESFNKINLFSTLIQPDNWVISPGAEAKHHISQKMCEDHGIPIQAALTVFNELGSLSRYQVAHNSWFDTKMLDIELSFLGIKPREWNDVVCTMMAMTPICKLHNPKMPHKFKWPSLIEAYTFCYGTGFEGSHDALVDTSACASVFKWLVENKKIVLVSDKLDNPISQT